MKLSLLTLDKDNYKFFVKMRSSQSNCKLTPPPQKKSFRASVGFEPMASALISAFLGQFAIA